VAIEYELWQSAIDDGVAAVCKVLNRHAPMMQRQILRRVNARYVAQRKKRETLAQKLARKSLRTPAPEVEG
jgi:hypothetical protein